ncbi:autotransporter domain-containing protein, partial [Burkholderia gladioli]|uniref:autotransporter domain-containing protein n=1 Tax=Burkholderia gladioli TaxID=28095 RepID=UPI001641FD0E
TPYVGMRAMHASQEGFAEGGENGRGSEVALDIGHVSENTAATEAGIRFTSEPVLLLDRPAQFSFSLAWDHQLTGGTHTAQAAFVSNPGEAWRVSGTTTGRDQASLSVGGSWQVSKSVTVSGSLNGGVGDHESQWGAQAGVQWKW